MVDIIDVKPISANTCKVIAQGFKGATGMCVPMNTKEFITRYRKMISEGQLIQDAFPDLSVSAREFLISGTTPEEWNKLFPKEDNV